jgi:micrococcal nuclease
MRSFAAAFVVLVSALAVGAADDGSAAPAGERARVARVVDGDTIDLANGARVRLLQIDTPEPGTGECYSRAAGRELRRLLPSGATVALEPDPQLGRVDAYGRLLRYVRRNGVNLNLELVRRGAATVWLYRGERGRYAERLLSAARSARSARRGLWGACPNAVWNPFGPATTGPGSGAQHATNPGRGIVGGACDPSYPTVCIPPPPPDLDCGDVPHGRFRVRPPDPHRFDGEGDGFGCER